MFTRGTKAKSTHSHATANRQFLTELIKNNPPTSKRCYMCETIKKKDQFYINRSHGDGLSSKCKSCTKDYNKANYEKNRNERISYQKEYYYNNKSDVLNKQHEHREKRMSDATYRDKYNKQQREYRKGLRYGKETREGYLSRCRRYQLNWKSKNNSCL